MHKKTKNKQKHWNVRNEFDLQDKPLAAQRVELQGEPLQAAMGESAASVPDSSDSGFCLMFFPTFFPHFSL